MSNILKYQNPSSPLLIRRVNQSDANFVKRLLDPNRKSIPDWANPLSISTHKLGWATENTKQGAFVYPEVQEINGELIDFTHPSRRRSEGINSAIERRDIVRMTPEQAEWFTENYKQYYPSFKKGGRIHIKKKNRGKFTEYCGGKVTEECIRKGKNSPNPLTRKRAAFAGASRTWKHENGGILKARNGVNLYPIYGSQQKAKFAYDAGSRNSEAIGALFANYRPTKAIGKSYSYTSRINGRENNNFQSYFKTTGNNNLGIEQKLGRINGKETDVTTFFLPNGDTYSENHIDETGQYNVDYAKRLGMDKLPKPKQLNW